MFCKICGAEIEGPGAIYCGGCGAVLSEQFPTGEEMMPDGTDYAQYGQPEGYDPSPGYAQYGQPEGYDPSPGYAQYGQTEGYEPSPGYAQYGQPEGYDPSPGYEQYGQQPGYIQYDPAQGYEQYGGVQYGAEPFPEKSGSNKTLLYVLIALLAVGVCAAGVFLVLRRGIVVGGDTADAGTSGADATISITERTDIDQSVPVELAPSETMPSETTTAAEQAPPEDKSIVITPAIQRSVNLYLSNFSEVGLASFAGHPSVPEMISYGYDHNFLNNYERIEYIAPENDGDWDINGEYYNVRIKAGYIRETAKKYFGYELTDAEMEASGVRSYRNGYYYSEETGGHMPDGFVVANRVEDLGNDRYRVRFYIYDQFLTKEATGGKSDIYALTENDVKDLKYDGDSVRRGEGEAVVITGDITDRNRFAIEEYRVIYY